MLEFATARELKKRKVLNLQNGQRDVSKFLNGSELAQKERKKISVVFHLDWDQCACVKTADLIHHDENTFTCTCDGTQTVMYE